ncbi:MAG: diguanylate cyclase [Lachnospiraceae bacterium]|nr:diguanylate cyclase [Lachnospiraceae bacterium]
MDSKKRLRVVITIILALYFPVALFGFCSRYFDRTYEYPIVRLENNWTVFMHGKLYFNQKLSNVRILNAEQGETIVLKTRVPANDIISPCLSFDTAYALVEVYVERDQIYSYGEDLLAVSELIPQKTHIIPLGNFENEEYELKIRLTTTEEGESYLLDEILIGNRNDLGKKNIQSKRLGLFVGVFLCIFSLMLFALSPVLALRKKHDLSGVFYGFACLLLGIYILEFFGLMNQFFETPGNTSFWRYAALYTLPMVLMLTIMFDSKVHFGQSRPMIVLVVIHAAFLMVTFGMHFSHVAHVERMLTPFHVLLLGEGLCVFINLFCMLYQIYKKKRSFRQVIEENIVGLGVFLLMICAMMDMIRFYHSVIVSGAKDPGIVAVYTTIGSLLFATCLIVNYVFHCVAYISNEKARVELEEIAYTDPLTQLANRAKCEQTLSDVAQTMQPYTIISLDLDRLKQINDTQGHEAGDSLIRGFAKILYETFSEEILVGRMGGDEFVVILDGCEKDRVTALVDKLHERMNFYNSKVGRYKYSASWGVAYSTELPMNSSHQIYMLADSRMYQMKQEHHQQTLDKLYRALSPKGGSES